MSIENRINALGGKGIDRVEVRKRCLDYLDEAGGATMPETGAALKLPIEQIGPAFTILALRGMIRETDERRSFRWKGKPWQPGEDWTLDNLRHHLGGWAIWKRNAQANAEKPSRFENAA